MAEYQSVCCYNGMLVIPFLYYHQVFDYLGSAWMALLQSQQDFFLCKTG